MTIGEKIKQIRQDKSLSQENVYPSNQSLVSQIEKGVNKNPTEQTLRIMADNMDMPFDELIEGDNFFEHAKIFDNWYGTLKAPVLKLLSKDISFIEQTMISPRRLLLPI